MDDGGPIQYLILFLIMLVGSAYFAATEMSLASVNKIRMVGYADNGNKQAKRVLYLLNNFDKALATLLIGNNVMHIGCATIATIFATKTWGVASVTVSTLVTTAIVFFAGEVLPKCYAKACCEKFMMNVAASLIFLMKLLTPLSAAFEWVSAQVRKPFKNKVEEPTVTEDELYDIIEMAVEEGALDEDTSELVQSAMEFSDRTVADAMTPWEKIVAVSSTMTPEEIIGLIQESGHSRIPVVDAEGKVTGVLQIRKYLKAYLQDNKPDLQDIVDPPKFASVHLPVDESLQLMSESQTHLFFVKDDQEKTVGIITVEDILEELVGEIYDEDDVEGGAQSA